MTRLNPRNPTRPGAWMAVVAVALCAVLTTGCGESEPPELVEARKNLDDAWSGGSSSANLKLLLTGLLAEHPELERSKTILNEALSHSSKDIRTQAIESLVAWDDPSVAENLLPLLEDQDELVRRAAARALGHYGSDAGKELLVAQIRTQDGSLNLNVCSLLHNIGDETCLAEAAKDLKGRNNDHRAVAAAVLGEMGGEQAVSALRAALARQRGVRRSPIIEALGRAGDASDVARLNKYAGYRENVLSVIRALGDLGGEDAQQRLRGFLDSDDPLAKLEAAGALMKTGAMDDAVLQAVRDVIGGGETTHRYLASKLLSPSRNDQTDAILAELAGDEDLHVQAQALNGLVGRQGETVYSAARGAWDRNKEAEIYEGPNPPLVALLIAVRGEGDQAKAMLAEAMESPNWAHVLRGSLGMLTHADRGAVAGAS